MAIAVGVYLVLKHLLLGDVVRNQTLDGALGAQFGQIVVGSARLNVVVLQYIDELGEGRGDPDTLLILHALHALLHDLLNNHGEVMLGLRVVDLVEVHEHGDEWGLSVGGHQCDDLILDSLDATLNLLPNAAFDNIEDDGLYIVTACVQRDGLELLLNFLANLPPGHVHKGSEVRQRDRLAAVLVGGHLGDDLGGNVAGGGKAVGLLNQGARDNGAVLEHILQVDQTAVVHTLEIVVAVVEVDDTFLMGFGDFLRQKEPVCDVTAQLACYVVTLGRQDCGVLVGVLLDDGLINVISDGENLSVQRAHIPQKLMFIAVFDIRLGDLIDALLHQPVLDIILDFLHRNRPMEILILERKPVGYTLSQILLVFDGMQVVNLAQGSVRSVTNLRFVEVDLSAISFDDDHNARPPL